MFYHFCFLHKGEGSLLSIVPMIYTAADVNLNVR